jgi:hypothetical protein
VPKEEAAHPFHHRSSASHARPIHLATLIRQVSGAFTSACPRSDSSSASISSKRSEYRRTASSFSVLTWFFRLLRFSNQPLAF